LEVETKKQKPSALLGRVGKGLNYTTIITALKEYNTTLGPGEI